MAKIIVEAGEAIEFATEESQEYGSLVNGMASGLKVPLLLR